MKQGSVLPVLARLPLLVLALSAGAADAAEDTPAPEPAIEEPGVGVVPRARPDGVPTLQMSTDYSQPGLGFGTYMPTAQIQARGFRVEPFTVLAGVQAGVGYDDNVALSSSRRVGSMFVTVAPSVAVGLDRPTQRYYIAYRGNYGAYSSDAQSDYNDHNVVLTAANEWTTRFRTLATYDYIRGHTPRGLTFTAATGGERWSQHTARGSATYGAPGARGELQGDLSYTGRRYSTSTSAVSGEYDRVELGTAFGYRVAPKTRATVRGTVAQVEHPADPTLDSTDARVLVGATWEATAKTNGRAAVGLITKDFDSPTRSDFTGYSFEVAANWSPQVQTQVNVAATRFLSETFEAGSSFLVNTVASASWAQLWRRAIQSTVGYTYGHVEHQGISRVDKYSAFSARVSYPFARSVRLGAELRRDGRSSDAPGFDYTRNIILLTAETAL